MLEIKTQVKNIAVVLAVVLTGITFGILFSSSHQQANNYKSSQQSQTQVEGANTTPDNQSTNAIDSTHSQKNQEAKVIRVIDGDTIEIEGGQRVRYIGIDTPEIVDPRTTVQCFGKEASAKNRKLVEGKVVQLEKDVSETDKYGRLLRYVYIDQTFVNDYLVRQGYAHASSYPPDIKYQDQFLEAQQNAQAAGRGLWSVCANQSASNTTQYNKEGCVIKGNISQSGEKIYHMPGQKYYDKTIIDESRGERWFCGEDEAVNATWRKSKL